jgi:hypothetical protein
MGWPDIPSSVAVTPRRVMGRLGIVVSVLLGAAIAAELLIVSRISGGIAAYHLSVPVGVGVAVGAALTSAWASVQPRR